MYVGTFAIEGNDDANNQFPADVEAAVNDFKSSGVTNLLIDVTDNGGSWPISIRCKNRLMQVAAGGLVCLGHFLHRFLAGSGIGSPYVFRIRSQVRP